MIDIHTHILPGVDDGARDMEDALMMAELAVESGVHTIIATPHCNIPGCVENYWGSELQNVYRNLQHEIERREIPLTLLMGMEIFATVSLPDRIRGNSFISLNHSGRYLIEFDFDMHPELMTDILGQVLEEGAFPIIAHPERYRAVQQYPELVTDWMDMGCQIQINKGSIFGKFGRAAYYAAEMLLDNDCVTYVASDAHSPYRRTTYMKDLEEYLQKEYSPKLAERVLRENPERYLLSGKR